jgi:hypothetical protein
MKKKYIPTTHKIHHNHEIYEYTIGEHHVLIKRPDGMPNLYDKNHIKGASRPNLLRRLLSRGRRNVKITSVDIEKFLAKHY